MENAEQMFSLQSTAPANQAICEVGIQHYLQHVVLFSDQGDLKYLKIIWKIVALFASIFSFSVFQCLWVVFLRVLYCKNCLFVAWSSSNKNVQNMIMSKEKKKICLIEHSVWSHTRSAGHADIIARENFFRKPLGKLFLHYSVTCNFIRKLKINLKAAYSWFISFIVVAFIFYAQNRRKSFLNNIVVRMKAKR